MTNRQAKAVVMRSRLMAIELAIATDLNVQKLQKGGWNYDGTLPITRTAFHVYFRKIGSDYSMGTTVTVDTP